jgi:CIC family chloride channel protein
MTKLQRLFLGLLAAFNVRSIGRFMFYGFFLGVAAGLGAVLFNILCQLGQYYLLDKLAGYRPAGPVGEPPLFGFSDTPFRRYLLFLIPALGGLVSGLIVYTLAPEAEGHGTDAAINAFHRKQGRIRGRVPFVKAIVSAITLGSGGSGGREGPIGQIGAGFGSFFADRLRLSTRDRRILLAAGLGAGIGSIFRAPLAGSLFAAEILYKDPDIETDVIIPAFVTTIVAYSVFGLMLGFEPLFGHIEFSFTHPIELGPYTVLAIVVGLASPVYIKTFYGTSRFFAGLSVPKYFRPAIGGLLVGCVGFFLPQTLAFGYGVVQSILRNEIAVWLLLAIAVGKILATSFTVGSGGSGGVFGPSMVIGAALGGVVGQISYRLAPGIVTQPGAFVVVGMAGFFSAVGHAPISTIIMVGEMTGNYSLLVPSMWVCAIAFIISRRWTIFHSQVPTRADSPAHQGDFIRDVLEEIHVRDVFRPDAHFKSVDETLSLRDFIQVMTAADQQIFPVVDASGKLTGVVDLNEVRDILVERGLDNVLVVKEIADEDIPSVTLDDDLTDVLRRLTENEVDSLPVVDRADRSKLLGLVHRRDVIRSYYAKLAAARGDSREDWR